MQQGMIDSGMDAGGSSFSMGSDFGAPSASPCGDVSTTGIGTDIFGTGTLDDTPRYLRPEQIAGLNSLEGIPIGVDIRADRLLAGVMISATQPPIDQFVEPHLSTSLSHGSSAPSGAAITPEGTELTAPKIGEVDFPKELFPSIAGQSVFNNQAAFSPFNERQSSSSFSFSSKAFLIACSLVGIGLFFVIL